MSPHEPTIATDRDYDGSLNGGGGNSEALDAGLLPEDFPDDRPLAARDYGTTEAEQRRREPLDRRLRREEPDTTSDADEDRDEVDDESPDLLSEGDDAGHDLVKDLIAIRARERQRDDDSGQLRSPRSPEEDAVHVVDDEPALTDD